MLIVFSPAQKIPHLFWKLTAAKGFHSFSTKSRYTNSNLVRPPSSLHVVFLYSSVLLHMHVVSEDGIRTQGETGGRRRVAVCCSVGFVDGLQGHIHLKKGRLSTDLARAAHRTGKSDTVLFIPLTCRF